MPLTEKELARFLGVRNLDLNSAPAPGSDAARFFSQSAVLRIVFRELGITFISCFLRDRQTDCIEPYAFNIWHSRHPKSIFYSQFNNSGYYLIFAFFFSRRAPNLIQRTILSSRDFFRSKAGKDRKVLVFDFLLKLLEHFNKFADDRFQVELSYKESKTEVDSSIFSLLSNILHILYGIPLELIAIVDS